MKKTRQVLPYKRLTIVASFALLALIIVLICLWVGRSGSSNIYECTNYAMGTYIQQTVYGSNREEGASLAAQRIGELEQLISWRVDDSDIEKLNTAGGNQEIEIDEKTMNLLTNCLKVAKASNGAFDPTILPVSSLWDFGGDNQGIPDTALLNKMLPYVDYNNLVLSQEKGTALLTESYCGIDLGAAGKGAACDEAIAAYTESGVDCAIIAVGGSVGVYGTKPDNSAWNVAVRDPNSSKSGNISLGSLDITSGFVSTSGSYEHQFTESGITYHHLLDPNTGYPAQSGLVSVTVTSDNGALSDILSTACFVLGIEEGTKLLEQYGAGGIFIDENNVITVTDNLKDQFTLSSDKYTLAESAS